MAAMCMHSAGFRTAMDELNNSSSSSSSSSNGSAPSLRVRSVGSVPIGKEFMSMYRAAGDELHMILQMQQQAAAEAAAAAHGRYIAASPGDRSTQLLDISNSIAPNNHIKTVNDAEMLITAPDNSMQLDWELDKEECYAEDDELNAAVATLCAALLSRPPLVYGTASAEQHCRELEAEIADLEAQLAGKGSPAAKRAVSKRLAAVMQLKCLECDLTCTLLEQHAAAEDLTAGGPATFKFNWHSMMKLEGRARSLKKQLAQQHGVQVELAPFPKTAAAAVLGLATAADARRRRYLAAAWKVAQRVTCRSSSLLAGLKKSSSITGRKLAEKISGSSRRRLSLLQP